jgi:hypothetical protein
MALCPLAIASKGNANDGTGEYYFALNGGGTGPVVDSAFVATGLGSPPNGGSFTTRSEDTTGAGLPAFVMTDIPGVARWAIGTTGIEAGANSGDNFAIFAYADNGAFLTAPMTINRASGGVAMPNGLTVGNTLISTGPASVGTAATVGGGLLEIEGTLGLGRVFDDVYNPALAPQINILVTQTSPFPASPLPAGFSSYNVGAVFQVPKTGLYALTGTVGINSAVGETFTCAPGDCVSLILQPQPVGALQGGVFVDLTPIPLGIEVDRTWTNSIVVKLTGLYNYQAQLGVYNLSGTMAYSAGNTVSSAISITALC